MLFPKDISIIIGLFLSNYKELLSWKYTDKFNYSIIYIANFISNQIYDDIEIINFNPINKYRFINVTNITYFDCLNNDHFSNKCLKFMPNLLHLKCNNTFTDIGLSYVPNLIILFIVFNKHFTNKAISYVKKLTTLYIGYNEKITDEAFAYIPNLTSLTTVIVKLTDKALSYVPNLTYLYSNIYFTDNGLSHVRNLITLDCICNTAFTDIGLSYLTKLKKLYIAYDGRFNNIRSDIEVNYN
jgi:hypothetical protein